MYHDFTYEATLASSLRAQWKLDDVLRADQELDFTRNFLPESLAQTANAPGLDSDEERRLLNQISAHQYLVLFGAVEEFILPFLVDHARPCLREDDFKARALLNFATEEAKHIHLFHRFHDAFVRGFPVKCEMCIQSEIMGRRVLNHDPVAVGLVILMIEWMTQDHYLGSIKDSGDIDPLFKSLLKHHWMEEAQHAKLDTLIVDEMTKGLSEQQILSAIKELLEICKFLSQGLQAQAILNIATLEKLAGPRNEHRAALIAQQHRAARRIYLGAGLDHERFKATLASISPKAAGLVAQVVVNIAAEDAATEKALAAA